MNVAQQYVSFGCHITIEPLLSGTQQKHRSWTYCQQERRITACSFVGLPKYRCVESFESKRRTWLLVQSNIEPYRFEGFEPRDVSRLDLRFGRRRLHLDSFDISLNKKSRGMAAMSSVSLLSVQARPARQFGIGNKSSNARPRSSAVMAVSKVTRVLHS